MRHIRGSYNLMKGVETAQEFMRVRSQTENSYLACAYFSVALLLTLNLLVVFPLYDDEFMFKFHGLLHLVQVHAFILINFIEKYAFNVDENRMFFIELLVFL